MPRGAGVHAALIPSRFNRRRVFLEASLRAGAQDLENYLGRLSIGACMVSTNIE